MKLAKNKKSLQTFTKQMQSLQTRSTLLIIILAAVLVEGASMVQYWYASKKIGQEVRQRAETELRAKSLEIQNQLQPVEVATQNIEGLVARNIHRPDTLKVIIEKWLDRNPSILGLCICFEANYFPERGRWYEPYTLRRSNGKYAHMQLGSASHDYLSSDWYLQGDVELCLYRYTHCSAQEDQRAQYRYRLGHSSDLYPFAQHQLRDDGAGDVHRL